MQTRAPAKPTLYLMPTENEIKIYINLVLYNLILIQLTSITEKTEIVHNMCIKQRYMHMHIIFYTIIGTCRCIEPMVGQKWLPRWQNQREKHGGTHAITWMFGK